MPLPTKNDLLTLNLAFLGTPFVQVPSNTAANTAGQGMNLAFQAEPFFIAGSDSGGSSRPQVWTST